MGGFYLADGAGTVGAAGGESLVVVLLAVRLPAPLEEGLPAQLLPAAGAGEVLGVPGFAQGRQHLQGWEQVRVPLPGGIAGLGTGLGGSPCPRWACSRRRRARWGWR